MEIKIRKIISFCFQILAILSILDINHLGSAFARIEQIRIVNR